MSEAAVKERAAHHASHAAAQQAATRHKRGVKLALHGVTKSFGEREVLHTTNLYIEPGEFVAIVGRSGCGKSTLLRLVAGLEEPSSGEIVLDGQVSHGLNEHTRIMFQDARLLPWRPVLDNVAIGLPKAERAHAQAVLTQVGLPDRGSDWPANLSGGQRQRVALARALVRRPELLLLDEPLGALDALTRIEMHALIEGLWQTHGFTALLVTHDVQEAVALADRVLLIEDGEIALDERINLPHPRERGSAAFAALEKRILDRVLAKPAPDDAGAQDFDDPRGGSGSEPPLAWRFAI